MIQLVKKFFGTDQGASDGTTAGHDIRLAVCAIFLEMCAIDGEFSEAERDRVLAILKRDYGLGTAEADGLIASAQEERDGSVDLWRFTHLINQNYSVQEKIRVVETAWEIAYTDGSLDKHEDYLVHKLADLLRLDHQQLIETKLRIKNRRDPRGG